MSTKPPTMRYLAGDVPPTSVTLLNAFQYVAVTSSFLVFPLIMAHEAHAPTAVADSMLSWSMLVLAIGSGDGDAAKDERGIRSRESDRAELTSFQTFAPS
jgi:hypothetical protein